MGVKLPYTDVAWKPELLYHAIPSHQVGSVPLWLFVPFFKALQALPTFI